MYYAFGLFCGCASNSTLLYGCTWRGVCFCEFEHLKIILAIMGLTHFRIQRTEIIFSKVVKLWCSGKSKIRSKSTALVLLSLMDSRHSDSAYGANSVLIVCLPHLGLAFGLFCNGIKDEWVVWPTKERQWGATGR